MFIIHQYQFLIPAGTMLKQGWMEMLDWRFCSLSLLVSHAASHLVSQNGQLCQENGKPRRTIDFQSLNGHPIRKPIIPSLSPFHQARSVPQVKKRTVLDVWNGYHIVFHSILMTITILCLLPPIWHQLYLKIHCFRRWLLKSFWWSHGIIPIED